jgi:hypothetical protein
MTGYEATLEEGRQEGAIRGTENAGQLRAWVVQAGTASTLQEFHIEPNTPSVP